MDVAAIVAAFDCDWHLQVDVSVAGVQNNVCRESLPGTASETLPSPVFKVQPFPMVEPVTASASMRPSLVLTSRLSKRPAGADVAVAGVSPEHAVNAFDFDSPIAAFQVEVALQIAQADGAVAGVQPDLTLARHVDFDNRPTVSHLEDVNTVGKAHFDLHASPVWWS